MLDSNTSIPQSETFDHFDTVSTQAGKASQASPNNTNTQGKKLATNANSKAGVKVAQLATEKKSLKDKANQEEIQEQWALLAEEELEATEEPIILAEADTGEGTAAETTSGAQEATGNDVPVSGAESAPGFGTVALGALGLGAIAAAAGGSSGGSSSRAPASAPARVEPAPEPARVESLTVQFIEPENDGDDVTLRLSNATGDVLLRYVAGQVEYFEGVFEFVINGVVVASFNTEDFEFDVIDLVNVNLTIDATTMAFVFNDADPDDEDPEDRVPNFPQVTGTGNLTLVVSEDTAEEFGPAQILLLNINNLDGNFTIDTPDDDSFTIVLDANSIINITGNFVVAGGVVDATQLENIIEAMNVEGNIILNSAIILTVQQVLDIANDEDFSAIRTDEKGEIRVLANAEDFADEEAYDAFVAALAALLNQPDADLLPPVVSFITTDEVLIEIFEAVARENDPNFSFSLALTVAQAVALKEFLLDENAEYNVTYSLVDSLENILAVADEDNAVFSGATSYTLTNDVYSVGPVSVADAQAEYALVAGIVDGASNASDLEVTDVFAWTIVDSLENILAVAEDAVFTDASDYELTEEVYDAGEVTVAQAQAAYALVAGIVAGASNDPALAVTDVFAWTIVDSLENILAVAEDAVFTDASDYELTEEVYDAGEVTVAQAQAAYALVAGIVAGASNDPALAVTDVFAWTIVDNLENILAVAEDAVFTDASDYELTEEVYDAGEVTVAQAQAAYALVAGIVAGASNDPALAVTDVFAWTILDSLENILAVKDDPVFTGADGYSLTNEPGDLGVITLEQEQLLLGAANANDYTYSLGEIINLTTGTDDLVGSDDPVDFATTFLAPGANTITEGDQINGNGGFNTFRIESDTLGFNLGFITITDVQRFELALEGGSFVIENLADKVNSTLGELNGFQVSSGQNAESNTVSRVTAIINANTFWSQSLKEDLIDSLNTYASRPGNQMSQTGGNSYTDWLTNVALPILRAASLEDLLGLDSLFEGDLSAFDFEQAVISFTGNGVLRQLLSSSIESLELYAGGNLEVVLDGDANLQKLKQVDVEAVGDVSLEIDGGPNLALLLEAKTALFEAEKALDERNALINAVAAAEQALAADLTANGSTESLLAALEAAEQALAADVTANGSTESLLAALEAAEQALAADVTANGSTESLLAALEAAEQALAADVTANGSTESLLAALEAAEQALAADVTANGSTESLLAALEAAEQALAADVTANGSTESLLAALEAAEQALAADVTANGSTESLLEVLNSATLALTARNQLITAQGEAQEAYDAAITPAQKATLSVTFVYTETGGGGGNGTFTVTINGKTYTATVSNTASFADFRTAVINALSADWAADITSSGNNRTLTATAKVAGEINIIDLAVSESHARVGTISSPSATTGADETLPATDSAVAIALNEANLALSDARTLEGEDQDLIDDVTDAQAAVDARQDLIDDVTDAQAAVDARQDLIDDVTDAQAAVDARQDLIDDVNDAQAAVDARQDLIDDVNDAQAAVDARQDLIDDVNDAQAAVDARQDLIDDVNDAQAAVDARQDLIDDVTDAENSLSVARQIATDDELSNAIQDAENEVIRLEGFAGLSAGLELINVDAGNDATVELINIGSPFVLNVEAGNDANVTLSEAFGSSINVEAGGTANLLMTGTESSLFSDYVTALSELADKQSAYDAATSFTAEKLAEKESAQSEFDSAQQDVNAATIVRDDAQIAKDNAESALSEAQTLLTNAVNDALELLDLTIVSKNGPEYEEALKTAISGTNWSSTLKSALIASLNATGTNVNNITNYNAWRNGDATTILNANKEGLLPEFDLVALQDAVNTATDVFNSAQSNLNNLSTTLQIKDDALDIANTNYQDALDAEIPLLDELNQALSAFELAQTALQIGVQNNLEVVTVDAVDAIVNIQNVYGEFTLDVHGDDSVNVSLNDAGVTAITLSGGASDDNSLTLSSTPFVTNIDLSGMVGEIEVDVSQAFFLDQVTVIIGESDVNYFTDANNGVVETFKFVGEEFGNIIIEGFNASEDLLDLTNIGDVMFVDGGFVGDFSILDDGTDTVIAFSDNTILGSITLVGVTDLQITNFVVNDPMNV